MKTPINAKISKFLHSYKLLIIKNIDKTIN